MKMKGQGAGIISAVMVALMVPLLLIMFYVVQVNFENAIDRTDWTAAQNLTFTDVQGNTQDSYDMAGILPIAVIGIAVLGAIIGALGGFIYLRR